MAYGGNTARIQLGDYGLLTDVPPGQVPRGALIRANNVSFESGTITKAPGSLRYNTSALSAGVVALFDYWPNLVTQRLIAATSDGKIYRDIGDKTFSGGSAIATGLGNLTPKSMFVQGGQETASRNKKLFFFSGSAQLKVLDGDGTSFANVSAPASDWTTPNFPTAGLLFRNRLWAFMGQIAYASDTGDHENFTSNYLASTVFPGEGGNIIGGHVFRGRLFVFKEGGFVYFLDDSASDSSTWYWKRLASNFGLASPHGIIEVGNDMIAVNESGSPVSYAAVDSFGDIESADLLRLLQIEEYYRSTISLAGLDVCYALYYEAKKQAFFTGRIGYRTTNNVLFHLDYNRQNVRACFWPKDSADCLALRKDVSRVMRPIYGSSDGYVYFMDREDRQVAGVAYTGEFKTGHDDFRALDPSLAHKNKLYDHLWIEFIPQGSWNISIDVYIDGTFSETITCLMDVRDDGLGSFTLDTDPLGREETQTIQKPLHGSGRRISFHIKQTGDNQNFAIASLTVGFRISGEQATRV